MLNLMVGVVNNIYVGFKQNINKVVIQMLNLKLIDNKVSEDIQIDPYIPIKIKFGRWNLANEETKYWRTGDFKKSLLEVGIASKSGVIRSITLVEAEHINLDSERIINYTVDTQSGVPVFDMSSWENSNRIDENGLLQVNFCERCLQIIFSENEIRTQVINERVKFGLDVNGGLCFIEVINLSEKEKYELKDSLQFLIS